MSIGDHLVLHYDPQYVDEGEKTEWTVTVTKIWDDGDFDVQNDSGTWSVSVNDIQRGLVRLQKTQTARPTPSETSSGAGLIADELTKLAELHRQGVLNDEEFATQKAKLLSR